MAPKYKLIYFNARGAGEPIRYLLSYGQMEFQDFRIEFEDWPQIKPNMPFLKVPVLEIDGKQMHQSISICSYLAKQVGLAGDNDLEALQIDAIAETIVDIRIQVYTYGWLTPESEKPKKKELLIQAIEEYLTRFEKLVQENKGYFVNGKLSYADVHFAASVGFFSSVLKTDIIQNYPNLKALTERVENLPNIKEWIKKRPKTDF